MFKHANTVSKGNKVRLAAASMGKTAGAHGEVEEVDADMGIAIVRWRDGSSAHIAVENLEREDG